MRSVITRCKQVGFTLVELMVSVVVLVIILAMAGPSMAEFTANNHLAASKSAFAAAVALARTEAARRGQTVIIQAIAGGAAGNEFKAGWELYVDVDGNGAVGGGDTLVRGFEAPSDKVKLSGTSPLAFQATGYLARVRGTQQSIEQFAQTVGGVTTAIPIDLRLALVAAPSSIPFASAATVARSTIS